MPGASDYTAQNVLNYLAGSLAMPALPPLFMALFTTAPTSDAGTGGTEVTGGSYARQQIAGALATNNTTASGNNTLHFASVPSWIVAGMLIRDATTPSVIPAATTVTSTTSTTVVMSANAAGGGVGNGDSITFSAFAAASASSGTEPAVTPAALVNSSAVVTFPQATVSWGTVVAFGLYDLVTAGNFLYFDWLGNFKWIPFTCTSASPGVLTVDNAADAYANGTSVVVTSKYGATLPTGMTSTGTPQTTAGLSGATFNIGVNTSSLGGGMIRQVQQQSIPANVTASFAANQLNVSLA